VNGAKVTDILKQTTHNSQKTNANIPWIETSGKKRNRNSSEITMQQKQPKENRHQLNKPVPTNPFERLEEVLDDDNNNIRMGNTAISNHPC